MTSFAIVDGLKYVGEILQIEFIRFIRNWLSPLIAFLFYKILYPSFTARTWTLDCIELRVSDVNVEKKLLKNSDDVIERKLKISGKVCRGKGRRRLQQLSELFHNKKLHPIPIYANNTFYDGYYEIETWTIGPSNYYFWFPYTIKLRKIGTKATHQEAYEVSNIVNLPNDWDI